MNALNLSAARPDPFSTFEFYQNYLRNGQLFGAGDRLWLLLVFSGDVLMGHIALKWRRHRVLGMQAAKLELLTAHHADRPGLISRPQHAPLVSGAIYAYLLSRRQEWGLLEFGEQDAASALLHPPTEASSGEFRHQLWPTMANGTVQIRWKSIARYFADLSKKSRSNVSRQMRNLLAAGDVQVLTICDPRSLAAAFDAYRSIEPHSWKARTEAVIGCAQQSVDYFRGLMEPEQPMQISIQLLFLDGEPIAGLISGAFDQSLYALHIVYDDRHARLAPGSAILLMGMRHAIEGGYQRFNLLRGFDYYKLRWLADMRGTQSLQIYRRVSPFHWRRILGDTRRRWAERWFGPADTGQARMNPVRHTRLGIEKVSCDSACVQLAYRTHRERFAALVCGARGGGGELLSAAQLDEALPFATSRRPSLSGRCPR
ncbi:GNAT family N-acetyltransferase [Lysobacter sp. CAU 1642]|uniref:GNAT family N-acetyltransferase n=2 Tax=Pseudomarimonas salicorniae TaxID=2933270 RepID=A0ABT0GGB6_9GAMM|nr:GNAT family N-acetyltransferase [Lysobacter sp. CAU 1642]